MKYKKWDVLTDKEDFYIIIDVKEGYYHIINLWGDRIEFRQYIINWFDNEKMEETSITRVESEILDIILSLPKVYEGDYNE